MLVFRRIDAIEHGYVAYLTAMERYASPKNHVLVGYHDPSSQSTIEASSTEQLRNFDQWLTSFRSQQ